MTGAPSLFLGGVLAMGYFLIGAFFLTFWRSTRDRLFPAFAVAFWLMAAGQGVIALMNIPRENQAPVYLLRLAAFLIILIAIISKNLSDRRR